jgi:DnaJ-class molecular chaperone
MKIDLFIVFFTVAAFAMIILRAKLKRQRHNPCPNCRGKGEIDEWVEDEPDWMASQSGCGGNGHWQTFQCTECGGTGRATLF